MPAKRKRKPIRKKTPLPKDHRRALRLVNSVRTPEQLHELVRDDPDRGSSRGIGVRRAASRRLLASRDALPRKRFESLDQVKAVRGVGSDTLHDIVYSARELDDDTLRDIAKARKADRRRKAVERANRSMRTGDHGVSIRRRNELHVCGRFLLDRKRKVVHDIAMETDECAFESLFKKGNAISHTGSLPDAIEEGYTHCEDCIGESPNDTFQGQDTILFVVNLPPRPSQARIDGVIERSEFKQRLLTRLVNRPEDTQALVSLSEEVGARSIWCLARRIVDHDRDPRSWGEPDVVVSLGQDPTTASRSDDVLVDMYIPESIVDDDDDTLVPFATKLLDRLRMIPSLAKSFEKHQATYGYRDIAMYVHSCESVDDYVVHHPTPKCSGKGGGSISVAGGFFPIMPTAITGVRA